MRHAVFPSIVLACAALGAACTARPSPLAEGERLWRAGVWDIDRVGFEPCIAPLERAVEASQGAPGQRLAFLLASAYVFTGRDQDAEPLIAIVRSGPPAAEPLLIDGYRASLTHARPQADLALTACIDRLGRSSSPFVEEMSFLAHLWRGQEHLWAADVDGAVADLDTARGYLLAHDAPVHRGLTRALVESHRILREAAPAEAVARDAVERDPEWAPHAFDLALVLAVESKQEEARALFEEALRRDPHYALPHIKLAWLALSEDDQDDLRHHLDRYDDLTHAQATEEGTPRDSLVDAEIAAGYGAYWLKRGRGDADRGDAVASQIAWGRAKDSLLRALRINPTCARALSLLIQVGGLLGEDPELIEAWKRELNTHANRLSKYPAAGDVGRTFC